MISPPLKKRTPVTSINLITSIHRTRARFEGEETPSQPLMTPPFSVSNMIEAHGEERKSAGNYLALTMGRSSRAWRTFVTWGKNRFGVGCTRPRFVIVASSFCRVLRRFPLFFPSPFFFLSFGVSSRSAPDDSLSRQRVRGVEKAERVRVFIAKKKGYGRRMEDRGNDVNCMEGVIDTRNFDALKF